jgi:hypothetical protein
VRLPALLFGVATVPIFFLKAYLDTEFQLEQKFIGTLGDGDVYLMVSPETGRQR